MSKELIKQYQNQTDWRIWENANQAYSYSGQNGFVINHINADFALSHIYSPDVAEAHRKAFIHIHDLSGLCNYCLGLDFEMFLMKGLDDIDGAPKHFTSALSMLHNTIFLISQEIAGAVAFNSVDTLLAPYIKKDKLSYKTVKQAIQEFVYTINVKGRIGFQSPFTNLQFDLTLPNRFKGRHPEICGEVMDFLYDDCQKEMEMVVKAFLETMMEAKRVLAFPVMNIGITKNFNWDSDIAKVIFKCIGQTGQPTLNNYVNGSYDPDAVKSLCCSLRLDMRQIQKQVGGQFGAADNSGSLGVVTLNLPRYAYLARGDKQRFFEYIDNYLNIAFKALVQKRDYVEEQMRRGMYPTVKRFIDDFRHFFNTVGVIGMNEMCLNLFGEGIDTDNGVELSLQVLDHINNRIGDFQEQNAHYYGKNQGLIANLELVPGEGVMYRFAKHDKEQYPDIITADGTDGIYYTRGCWLPAEKEYTLSFATKHQEVLQDKFSGGANFQHFTNEPIHNWKAVKSLVYKLITQTKLPFISISPTRYVCPICGVKQTATEYCEHNLTYEQVEELRKKGIEFKEDDNYGGYV